MSTSIKAKGPESRHTRQREIILEELRKLTTHPRSDELYVLVRQRLPRISLGTVYRNLDKLQREGMAAEIYCGDFVRYDANVSVHDHFMCRACLRVWDLDAGQVGPASSAPRIADDTGFKIESQYTMFLGLCPECTAVG